MKLNNIQKENLKKVLKTGNILLSEVYRDEVYKSSWFKMPVDSPFTFKIADVASRWLSVTS